MSFQKPTAGQSLQTTPIASATFQSHLVDVVDDFNRHKMGASTPKQTPPIKSNEIRIANGSAADRRKGEVLKIGTFSLSDVDRRTLWFNGTVPTDSTDTVAVLLEPIKYADTGYFQAQVTGVVPALVDIQTEGDAWAVIDPSSPVLISATSSGMFPILHAPSGTGEKDCVILMDRSGESTNKTAFVEIYRKPVDAAFSEKEFIVADSNWHFLRVQGLADRTFSDMGLDIEGSIDATHPLITLNQSGYYQFELFFTAHLELVAGCGDSHSTHAGLSGSNVDTYQATTDSGGSPSHVHTVTVDQKNIVASGVMIYLSDHDSVVGPYQLIDDLLPIPDNLLNASSRFSHHHGSNVIEFNLADLEVDYVRFDLKAMHICGGDSGRKMWLHDYVGSNPTSNIDTTRKIILKITKFASNPFGE